MHKIILKYNNFIISVLIFACFFITSDFTALGASNSPPVPFPSELSGKPPVAINNMPKLRTLSPDNSSSKPATVNKNIDSNIKLNSNDLKKPEIKINEPVKKIDGKLFNSDQEKMQHAFQTQKKMDIDDIKMLWEATVERNTVIKFALRKLAMPAEQRRIHSSIMAKSVSALISGVSILPSIFGLDSLSSSAAMAGGSLANRVVQAKTMPKEMPLTDTELIQLAKLIETLQDKIIKNYYDYKSSIEALRVCRQNLILYNKNYNDSIRSGNYIAIVANSALYDKELLNELRLKEQIKLYRLDLERLAGSETVSNLTMTKLSSFNADAAKPLSKINTDFASFNKPGESRESVKGEIKK